VLYGATPREDLEIYDRILAAVIHLLRGLIYGFWEIGGAQWRLNVGAAGALAMTKAPGVIPRRLHRGGLNA